MLDLRARLGQLRGQTAPVLPTLDAEWSERLARLRLLARERHGQVAQDAPPLPGIELAPGLRLHEVRVSALRLKLAGLDLPADLVPPWDPESRVAIDQLRLFDTETSGLCGGAGLKVFLLGVLRWQDDSWLLRQYLLTSPAGEDALVRAWVDECAGDAHLVSYNGKRFDVPAMRTLETLHGLVSRAPEAAHWDLLYPVRRAFRGVWSDCRLVTAERMLVGRERHDDLPGSEAPRAWREFLSQGHTRDLLRVMQHNRYDLEALLRVFKAMLQVPASAPRQRVRKLRMPKVRAA
ncbi:MAG TPA: ribonuclease H-like domain-containing protein [Xanthomonadales bacterium]|nr:ribonuclease H-like domain-containing protein [Xanthomonadales bacterium]